MADQVSVGSLREVVQVQQRTTQANGYGELVPTWATLDALRARVEPLGGSEVAARLLKSVWNGDYSAG